MFGYCLFVAVAICVFHLFFHPYRVLGMDTSIFYMDEKYTLAAFYSTVTSFLVGYIAFNNSPLISNKLTRTANSVFATFFLTLAIDEYFEVHEYINTLIKANFNHHGLVTKLSQTSWIFPLIIVIVAIFVMIMEKIKLSPSEARAAYVIGGCLFAVILIFELFGSVSYGNNIYLYLIAVEEGLEMISVAFFLLGVLIEKEFLRSKLAAAHKKR